MLVRVVKMTFREDAIDTFKGFFEGRKEQIRGFEGCTHLELWQDNLHQNIFFTYSYWQDESSLNHYRNSAFFRDTWSLTKQMFSAKAEAYSVNRLVVLP
ncbi:MAG: antibiotic biosynthesis monooxygenase [Segetibacter sp.]|jgi:heme-degrading monooxygenase HmoA|nr:antibiotic biosynthesis monooxygenase [Segetibacter sp.]